MAKLNTIKVGDIRRTEVTKPAGFYKVYGKEEFFEVTKETPMIRVDEFRRDPVYPVTGKPGWWEAGYEESAISYDLTTNLGPYR